MVLAKRPSGVSPRIRHSRSAPLAPAALNGTRSSASHNSTNGLTLSTLVTTVIKAEAANPVCGSVAVTFTRMKSPSIALTGGAWKRPSITVPGLEDCPQTSSAHQLSPGVNGVTVSGWVALAEMIGSRGESSKVVRRGAMLPKQAMSLGITTSSAMIAPPNFVRSVSRAVCSTSISACKLRWIGRMTNWTRLVRGSRTARYVTINISRKISFSTRSRFIAEVASEAGISVPSSGGCGSAGFVRLKSSNSITPLSFI